MKTTCTVVPGPLRVRWRRIAAAALLGWCAGLGLLWHSLPVPLATRWAALSLATVLGVLCLIQRRLPLNRGTGDGVVRPALGLGNGLTVLRGLLLAPVAGFIFLPWREVAAAGLGWIPGLLYLAAVLLDGCDGYAARRGGRTSLLGAGLDTLFDALGLALAACLLVAWGKAPTLYLTAGAAYYLFKGALAWRRKRRLAVTAVRPWNGARLLAGFQMGFAAAALLPLFSPPVTRLASWVALAPFLGGFLRDWRIATGQRAEACQGAAQPERSMGRRALQWVPPLLRLGLVPAALLPQGMPVRGVDLLLLALAVAGVCGRLAALLLAVTWGLALSGRSDLRCGEQTMLAMALVLTLTGSGPLALWRPEDRWLARRPGETAEEQR